MRTFKFYVVLYLAILGILLIVSCTTNDPVTPAPADIENQVQHATWRITSFIDSGRDETNHFTGFSFSFSSNSVVTAANGSTVHTGTWSVTDDQVNDDSPGIPDFTLFFNLTNDFSDLNEDWQVQSRSDTRIDLIHVSGGNGGTDYLTFTKI